MIKVQKIWKNCNEVSTKKKKNVNGIKTKKKWGKLVEKIDGGIVNFLL